MLKATVYPCKLLILRGSGAGRRSTTFWEYTSRGKRSFDDVEVNSCGKVSRRWSIPRATRISHSRSSTSASGDEDGVGVGDLCGGGVKNGTGRWAIRDRYLAGVGDTGNTIPRDARPTLTTRETDRDIVCEVELAMVKC